MEERLDDAINVLRNHCEPQLAGLGVVDPSVLTGVGPGGSVLALANSVGGAAATSGRGGVESVNIKQERGTSESPCYI